MKIVGIPFKSLLFLGLITLASVIGCSTMNTEDKIQKATSHFQLGVSYLNDNNIQPAFVEFQKALELNPEDKEVLNALGVIYLLKLEDYPKAVEHFKRALAVDGSFSEASNNMGLACEKMGMFREAVDAYRAALTNPLYRNAEKALNNLGRSFYRLGRFDDAIDAYKESIKRFSNFHLPYYGLALSYNAKGLREDAQNALRKAIEYDPMFRGDRKMAVKGMSEIKLILKGDEERDLEVLLKIMNY